MTPLKVLVLSRSYPNRVLPYSGLWVEGLVRHAAGLCEPRVIAPVPYCPPLPGFVPYTRFRRIAPRERAKSIEVWHPRFLVGPGYSLHSFEASTYYWGVQHRVEDLHREFPFDLIHAHFSYPDGVVAARLARRYRVPALITEHAPWLPWMEDYPRVRHQAVWGFGECVFHIPVSRYVRNTIVHFTGESEKLRVIPVGVDGSIFAPPSDGRKPDVNQILYVGFINFTKGVDVLLRAMPRLVDRRPEVRLVLVGGSFYRHTRRQENRLRRMAQELRLDGHVEFVGMKPPHEVAAFMRESALLVLPSRAESFGAVLVEALACSIPIIATRSGGPEDILTEEVGVLVPSEDADALAEAIEHVLEHRDTYEPARLRAYALEHYAWERIARRTVDLYHQAVDRLRH